VRKHKERCVKQLVSGVKGLLNRELIDLHRGAAKLLSPQELELTAADGQTQRLQARRLLLATGSQPLILPIPGVDAENVVTSDEAVDLPGPPARLVIVGGGAIGVEFAYIYSRMGTQVTVLEMLTQIVPTEDADVAEVLAGSLSKGGVRIQTGSRVMAIEHGGSASRVCYDVGGESQEVEADLVLLARDARLRYKSWGWRRSESRPSAGDHR